MKIDEAIKIAKQECKDPYAKAYLDAIPQAIDEYGMEGFETQILYVFTNMAHWRGPVAREVKLVIKSWLKKRQLI